MSSIPEEEIAAAILPLLPPGSTLYPFARAVVEHLGSPRGLRPRARVIQEVLQLLTEAGAHPVEPYSLLEDPELLASCFQNADLLDPADPASTAVLRNIAEALERSWPTE